jgi:hypothetical protein
MPWRHTLVILAVAALPACAAADGAALDIPSFDRLQSKATQTVNVQLDGLALRFASHFLDSNDPGQAQARGILSQLDSVQVRSFEFDSDGAYSQADVEAVRKQLASPKWTPIVQVRKGTQGENVDIFMCIENEKPVGFAIISSQPRELTIVNVSGPIDLERLKELGGHLGIPKTHS